MLSFLGKNWLCLLFFLFLLGYLLLRAAVVPFSCDEYISLISFIQKDWLDILLSRHENPALASNNHVLNSLFSKCSMLVFGNHDWAMRIHSLAAFAVSYFYAWKTLALYQSRQWVLFAGLSILFLNPYLLDFFALARGYALCIAGWMAANYHFIRYMEKPGLRDIRCFLAFMFISVYANFSAVYFMVLYINAPFLLDRQFRQHL